MKNKNMKLDKQHNLCKCGKIKWLHSKQCMKCQANGKHRQLSRLSPEARKITKKLTIILFLEFSLIFLNLFGGYLNILVQNNNNGRMPVYDKSINSAVGITLSYYEDDQHFSYSNPKSIKYPILSDIIPMFGNIYSIGDLIMYLSMFLWIPMFAATLFYSYKAWKVMIK